VAPLSAGRQPLGTWSSNWAAAVGNMVFKTCAQPSELVENLSAGSVPRTLRPAPLILSIFGGLKFIGNIPPKLGVLGAGSVVRTLRSGFAIKN
jgi:hypothetical protein